jgi:hemoglobin/transferrin/lactoferrin receptor protein
MSFLPSFLYPALIAVLTTSSAAMAADPDISPDDEVTVSATKIATPLLEVPATVTVISSDEIERRLQGDIKDLVRYEPNVSVRNRPDRFALSDFNIRGIEGNRVLIEVDNVRIPDTFTIGSYSNASRDGVDIDLLKRLEIVRGSASSLYGSDAIGGVVAFTTKDPADLIREGRSTYFGVRGGYGDAHAGYVGTGTTAVRFGRWSALAMYSHEETSESENRGGNDVTGAARTTPNPQDGYGDSVLLKAVFDASDTQQLRLTLENVRHELATDLLTSRSSTAALDVNSLLGDDEFLRRRASLEHAFEDLGWDWLDAGSWRIYDQRSETTQYTTESRTVRNAAGTSNRVRDRRFDFDQHLQGVEITLHKSWRWGVTAQRVTLGLEYLDTHTAQRRDGGETNLTTSTTTHVVLPDTFPVRDFPLSDTRTASIYLQDEMRIGRWIVTPGARLDRYELTPRPDAIFVADNPGIVPADMEDSHVSPKLGVVWLASDDLSVFASYNSGFRFPPYADVNVGFTNFAFGYTAIPNPDLKPESSDNFETGLKYSRDGLRVELSAFYNRYKDFIQSFATVGVDPDTGLLVFQSQNLGKVRTYGAEAKLTWPLGLGSEKLAGLNWQTAIGFARGTDRATDVPLDSIDPLRVVGGFDYRPVNAPWNAAITMSWVDAKDHIDPAANQFLPGSHTTVDLYGEYRFGEHLRLNAGIYNLTDEKYWEWTDVRGRPAGDIAIDRFTRPGRSVSASLKVEF